MRENAVVREDGLVERIDDDREILERTFTTPRDFSPPGTKLSAVCLLFRHGRHGITKSRITRSPASVSSYILIANPVQVAPLSPRVHFTSPLYCFAARPTMGRKR